MSFTQRTEEYYKKFMELQEKLRKSEEERLKLEMKFNEMLRVTKEEEQMHYRKLRSQYQRFLEEDRRRQDRNERIVRTLERIESRVGMLMAKTERFKLLRKQYQIYLDRMFKDAQKKPEIENVELKKVTAEEQGDPVRNYLQNVSSQKLRELLRNEEDARGRLPFPASFFDEKNEEVYKPNRAANIAEDIMTSIQNRYYNKDLKLSRVRERNNNYKMKSFEQFELPKTKGFDQRRSHTSEFGKEKRNVEESDEELSDTSFYYDKNSLEVPHSDNDLSSEHSPEVPNYVVKKKLEELKLKQKDVKESFDQPDIYKLPKENLPIDTNKKYDNREEAKVKFNEKPIFQQKIEVPQVKLEENKNLPSLKQEIENQFNISKQQHLQNDQELTVKRQLSSDQLLEKLSIEETVKKEEKLPQLPEFPQKVDLDQTIEEKVDKNQYQRHPEEHERIKLHISEEDYQYQKSLKQPVVQEENKQPQQVPQEKDYQQQQIRQENYQNQQVRPEEDYQYQQTRQEKEHQPQQISQKEEYQPKQISQEEDYQYQQTRQEEEYQPQQIRREEDYQPKQISQKEDYQKPQIRQEEEYQPQQIRREEDYQPEQISQEEDYQNQPAQQISQEEDYQNQPAQQISQEEDYQNQPAQQYNDPAQPVTTQDYYVSTDQQNQDINQQLYDQYQPQYDENGQLIQQYDETGQPIMQQYDQGQFIQQYDDQGQFVQQYDEHGQPYQQYESQYIQQYPQYDENGQLIQQYDESGQPIAQYDASQYQQYDESGQLIQQYDYAQYGEGAGQEGGDQQYVEGGGAEEKVVEVVEEKKVEVPVGEKEEESEEVVAPVEAKMSNVMEMLDTDTESAKQDTKVSNDSDFDFSNS